MAEYSRLPTWELYLSSRSAVTSLFFHYIMVYYTENAQIFDTPSQVLSYALNNRVTPLISRQL